MKKGFSIKKVRRVMRMKSEGFEPTTYEVWKLTGPRGFVKYFVSRKDGMNFYKQYTSTKISK
jgi:hypothetical protein